MLVIDAIQKRYGWTDEVVLNLPFTRFLDIVKTIAKAEQQEAQDKFVLAAFIGWQIAGCLGYDKPFGEYLRTLRLLNRADEDWKEVKEEALRKAEEVVRLDRQRR